MTSENIIELEICNDKNLFDYEKKLKVYFPFKPYPT